MIEDLSKVLALPEIIVHYLMEGESKKAINNTVLFFNTFQTNPGIDLYLLLSDSRVHPQMKAVLKFLGLWDGEFDEEFYINMLKET